MNRTLIVMVGSLIAAVALYSFLGEEDRATQSVDGTETETVQLYCAASNRAVIEKIANDYKSESGRTVEIEYGPSQTLFSKIEVSKSGDLYLPADDSYLEMARERGLVQEVIPIAKMQGVICVPKGNPKKIQTFDDLLKADIRVVQANEAAAIGKQTRRVLGEKQLWEKLDKATLEGPGYRTTVTDVANDVKVGSADAGIVYDAVLHTYPDLEYIELPEFDGIAAVSAIGVINGSEQPTTALHFARYVAARDRGLIQYANHGFRTELGDQWADVPQLKVFAGSMLRPAIEDTIAAFEKREGVRVDRSYNGCGILVGQMKTGVRPDAYFACDTEFMNQVSDLFPFPTDVSQNQLVIALQKGNPKNIKSLRDLTRPGLRVGVGHEKQCAMGWLTQNTLKEGKVQEGVMSNVTVQSPTGDLLINQMKTGSLDAAVVYLSNMAGSGEVLDAIPIVDIDCSIATQPWAVGKDSAYPQILGRLFEAICSADSQETFAAEGFTWTASATEEN